MIKKILSFLLLAGFIFTAKAQLSEIHYLPPLKQTANNISVRDQVVYLSTPETTAFTVSMYIGTAVAPAQTFSIDNLNPGLYTLPDGDNNITMVNNTNTGVVLTGSGLRFESSGGERFYVNYRGVSSSQGVSLTSKGSVARGRNFKWGGTPNVGTFAELSTTLGILATEDNTVVDIFGYDPACAFRLQGNRGGITDDTMQITLNAGESYVLEAHVRESTANVDGWLGASIVATKNIVISNGGLNTSPIAGFNGRDGGIDQPVPEDKIGRQYALIRGNGSNSTEFGIVIATQDNTNVTVNGSATPIANLDNGDYVIVPATEFSGTGPGSNMLIETSKNAYVYQSMAGSTANQTTSLNFLAPLNCEMEDRMDNIPNVTSLAGTGITGGITIIASTATLEANIVVTDGSGVVTKPTPLAIAGTTEWRTYFITGLTGNVKVESTGPIAVGFFGVNNNLGVAGYFAGFDNIPVVDVQVVGGGGCLPNTDVTEVSGNFDAYQWYEDGVLIPGANQLTYAPDISTDYFVRVTKGSCTYDSRVLSAYYCDPDVVLNKTVDKTEIIEGETATFTLEVQNNSIVPLTNLVITDALPTGLTVVSSFTTTGTLNGLVWDIGNLDTGVTATLELTVVGDEIVGIEPLVSLVNSISNTQDQLDANLTEDITDARIIVHNDWDKDGVRDITDLDDDNDGIFDEDECEETICFDPIINESFEEPVIPSTSFRTLNENIVPGWLTTATDSNIEIWSNDFLGVPAFHGNQFAELNATQNSALYQNLCLTPGTVMQWSLRHRARVGEDVMRVRIGADLATATVRGDITKESNNTTNLSEIRSDTSRWELYSGTYTVPANQINTVFIFEAVSTGAGSRSVGNLIDDIRISVVSVQSCRDTDNDGIPDNLDLDSDDDGCSDANEYYKDNADGGDDFEFGTGTPVIDPADGTVNSASYVEVFAPEIFLGNTSEDLGGTDIDGEQIGLGESFEYVLRFQNTGDDNATNYTIRDVLPSSVNFDMVDTSDALGVTFVHDVPTNTLTFSVPDNLVRVGDPEYSIRIQVTTSNACSEFVDSCSGILENTAYSTFQGVINPLVFTDENGATIGGCPASVDVATNSLFDALQNCNQARTVQLCDDDVVLQAGLGFTSYNWVIDDNNNGVVDNTDTVVNDGDPDNDPSTILVTAIGTYIVEKSTNGTCPDQVEIIEVERFGTTQNNPILDFFNQVNNDGNPDNNLEGTTTICPADGDVLPNIFLCGANDQTTIQLGISDSDSMLWQKLDESSCGDAGADCANKDASCTWATVATTDDFTVTDSGEYRVVINYNGGCFSRFYFNVFKNEYDIQFDQSDILCATPGNIRVTNPISGYGYQLIDASDDSILIPYSAGNGPNFDIANNGTYKIEAVLLDPNASVPTPLAGSCVFETEDIGIQERNFTVGLSSTPEDCDDLGTVTVQVLNALPNYDYELRLADGSLIGRFPTETSNTYTFENLIPGDYVVTVNTQDGCLDVQNIRVDKTPEVTLTAVTSQNITCVSGIVTLTPGGGSTGTAYNMAIWSFNNVDLYADEASVPASELQTATSFVFPNASEAGRYEFIVFDDDGCFKISNSVEVLDLGTVVVNTVTDNDNIVCADSATASITVNATGGTLPYSYSLDGGITNQSVSSFLNLAAGTYTITVTDSSNNGPTGCIATFEHVITQPFRLNASATIIEDSSCDPNGALVKIKNVSGGQAPYLFSFNGSAFSAIDEMNLLPGNHLFAVEDALGCIIDLELTVPSSVVNPTFSSSVTYACDGLGTITVVPSNTTDFNYTYTLNSIAFPPITNNVFSNVPVGSQMVNITYEPIVNASASTLFLETFGAGVTTEIAEIGPGYCFEAQDPDITNSCNASTPGVLTNREYAVTNLITNPVVLRSPIDHTGLVDGRFLAIDVSTLAGTQGILWAKRDLEVLANKEITVSFWAYNFSDASRTGDNPEVFVELVNASGTVIATELTSGGEIPKNTDTGATSWHLREVTFNPGANTDVDIVLRSNVDSDDGNDLVLDDIQASQQPDVCGKTENIPVVVEDNQAFEAVLLNPIDPSCSNTTDGAFRFEVSNFDATTGFEYSIDGGAWITSMVSPVTTASNLASGTYPIAVRKIADNTCVSNFSVTLTSPTVIVPSLNQIVDFTCLNTGGTLEASAIGGNPGYEYQLENTAGTIIEVYQTDARFPNITDGDYLVRVKDQNNCEVLSTITITIDPPTVVVFDLDATECYASNNDATITVNVTAGNGNYEFKLDNGPWITPSPANATTYIFDGLANGTYDVEVRDQLGCPNPAIPNTQTIEIGEQLVVVVDVTPLTACSDGEIIINATGGNNTLLYAIVPANASPVGLFTANNSLTITEAMATANPLGYDAYVQDNNGSPALCTFVEEDIIFTPITPLGVTPSATDPACFGDFGTVSATVTGGTAPYTYTLVDLSPADAIDYGTSTTSIFATSHTFNSIGAGTYEVTITDNGTCTVTSSITVTITEAIEITADIDPLLPSACSSTIESDYGFQFSNITNPTGTLEYSNDGGTTWQTSDELRGSVANPTFSGTVVFPSIRVEVSPGVYCQKNFSRYIIPFPLDDLDIDVVPIVVNCNELQVTVQGTQGVKPYEYAISSDPTNFDPATATWFPGGSLDSSGAIVPLGEGRYEWLGLDPGRTYVFYVRDSSGATGCVRQSLVNVNDIVTPLPVEVTFDVTPTCDGLTTGEITFTIDPVTAYPNMRWEIYEVGNPNPIEVSGAIVPAAAINIPYTNMITTSLPLGEGDYYIEVTQVEADNTTDACSGASENAYVSELAPLAAIATSARDISCNLPGLINITSITGGGGSPYTYNVSGPSGFTLTGITGNPIEIPVNSPAGNYTVTLFDQFSCSVVIMPAVAMAVTPNPTLSSVVQDNCEAPIKVTATGVSAAGNLRYALVNAGDPLPTTYEDNGGVFPNVAPGTYDVYVRDGNGCTAVDLGYVVNSILSASATLTKVLDCTASADATIAIEIPNGSGSYEYSITNTAGIAAVAQTTVPGTSFVYNASAAGDYTITIFDTNTPSSTLCNRTFTVIVPNRVEPIIDTAGIVVTPISCTGDNDGTITIGTTNSSAGPYTFEITSLDGAVTSILPTSTSGNTATFTGLVPTTTAGGYIITVTGEPTANNCAVDSNPITISEPTAIMIPTPTVVEFICSSGNADENASITVNGVNGGSNTYTNYEFIREDDPNTAAVEAPVTVQSGSSISYTETNFDGGLYTINVRDNTGCVGTTTATIARFEPLVEADIIITIDDPISCVNGGEDITFDFPAYSANPANYTFEIISVGTPQGPVFTNLASGSYNFLIKNITTGCEVIKNHNIEDPNTFDLVVRETVNVVCFGSGATVQLSITDATYTAGFDYEIYEINNTPLNRIDDTFLTGGSSAGLGPIDVANIPVGNYLVEAIQDGLPNCGQVRYFSIAGPSAPITLAPVTLTDVGCNDQGTALVTVLGGQGPYTITLTNDANALTETVTVASSYSFMNLGAATYSLSVTDDLGCPINFTNEFTLNSTPAITGMVLDTQLECREDTDATLTFNLAARTTIATPNYRYILNRYATAAGTNLLSKTVSQPMNVFDNLGAGFYTILVLDDIDSCPHESAVFEIVEPTEASALLITATPLSCDSGAELELRATGGTGPYEWSIDGSTGSFATMNEINGPDTHLFQNVSVDNYQYFIRDANQCVSTISNGVTVSAVPPLTIAIDVTGAFVSCNGDDTGSIIAEADGGLGNYMYGLFEDQALTIVVTPYQTSGTFTNLLAGSYYVGVTSDDCEETSELITIAEPELLIAMEIVNNVTCKDENDGSIIINLSGGTGDYQYAISPNLNQFDDVNTFEGLSPGDYTVIAQDSNGCNAILFLEITEPELLEMGATSTPEICAGDEDGTITVNITGGTAPYSTSLNSNDDADFVQDQLIFDFLAGDTYVVFVKDAMGCETDIIVEVGSGADLTATAEVIYECSDSTGVTNRVEVRLEDQTVLADVLYGLDTTDPNQMVLDPNFENVPAGSHFITVAHANGCAVPVPFEILEFETLQVSAEQQNLNEITAVVTGGREEYTYFFDGEDNGSDNTFRINRTDTYEVSVVDANGCVATTNIFMEFIDIEIPNFFTPDGDGQNDFWIPKNIEQYPAIWITIYDRYGRSVFQLEDSPQGWDGFYKENTLPTGDYWYIIKLNGVEDTREFVGHFTLYR